MEEEEATRNGLSPSSPPPPPLLHPRSLLPPDPREVRDGAASIIAACGGRGEKGSKGGGETPGLLAKENFYLSKKQHYDTSKKRMGQSKAFFSRPLWDRPGNVAWRLTHSRGGVSSVGTTQQTDEAKSVGGKGTCCST